MSEAIRAEGLTKAYGGIKADEDIMNEVARQLQAAGAHIAELKRQEESLEDIFLETVRGK